jgi:hypothetical protein
MIFTEIEQLEFLLTEILSDEWEAQGHAMTSAITKNIEYKVKREAMTLILSGMIYPYGNIIAAGTKASKIPFSGRTGRGGTSLYISALQRYVKNKMDIDDEKKSLSIAFAIAHTQKKEGMPTSGSYRFTQTGKRTDWVEEALRKNEDRIAEVISTMAYNQLTVTIDALLARWQILLNEEIAA